MSGVRGQPEGMAVNVLTHEPTERDKVLLRGLEKTLRELRGRRPQPPGA